jgi:hypothetical protein
MMTQPQASTPSVPPEPAAGFVERRAGHVNGVRIGDVPAHRQGEGILALRVVAARRGAEHGFDDCWPWHIEAALLAWGRLTEDDLRGTGGRPELLTRLVQERYALPPEDAARRVRRFLDKQGS